MNTEGKLLHKQEEVAATLKFLFCQNDAKSPGTNRVIFFFLVIYQLNQAWSHKAVNSALRKWRKEKQKSKVTLG